MTDASPRHQGGQGVVTAGTLSLPEAIKIFVCGIRSFVEDLGISFKEYLKVFRPELRQVTLDWPPELTVDAAVEMLGMSPKALEEWVPETRVAVKMFGWNRDDAEVSTKFVKSFAHELSLMAELSHPNVVQLVGYVEEMEKGKAWIILPWESNGNVREFLQSGEWDIPERISLIQDTARGLEYLHSRQPPICHGDLKSLNILVNSSYRAVITDFGSARIRRNVVSKERENPSVNDGGASGGTSPEVKFNTSTQELTLTGPKFSLRWTAPEVLDDGEQDLPSDMWAIGWICWEIITGRLPFEELNKETAIIMCTIEGNLPAIREDIDLSHVLKLCGLMSGCWDLKPVKRVDASSFQRRVRMMPSAIPSGHATGGQKTRSAHLLFEQGRMYHVQASYSKAVACYQSAIDVATQTRDEETKGRALDSLGQLYHHQGREDEAEQTLFEAHDVFSRIGSDQGVAHALKSLGEVYRAQSKNCEAEKALMEAYEMCARIGDIPGAAGALAGLGLTYQSRLLNEEAGTALMKAYEMYSGVGEDLGAAHALEGLGLVYQAQAQYCKAEKVLMKAHEIHTRIGNHLGAVNALNGLGDTYQAQSRNREAEKAFNEAYKILPLVDNNLTTARTFRSLGKLHQDQCRYDEAEGSYRQALAAYDRAHDAGSKSTVLTMLGRLYHAQDRYFEAEEAVAEALAIWISLGDEVHQAGANWVLADIFNSQSKHAEAIATLIQAEAALARTSHDALRAKTLHRLGDIHAKQGTHAEAEEYYRHAQAIFSSMEDARGEARALLGLGALFHQQSRRSEAEECFAQARVAFAIAADQDGEANALDGLMTMYFLQHKFGDAKVACMEACEMYAQRGQPMSEVCRTTLMVLQDRALLLQRMKELPLGSLLARFFES